MQRPNLDPSDHIIFSDDYVLETPEIRRLLDKVADWFIRQRTPGALIWGVPRSGKTHALVAVAAFLSQHFGERSILVTGDVEDLKQPSRSEFFGMLLEGIGHAIPRKGSAEQRQERLMEFLRSEGQRRLTITKKKTWIFFLFDEAQNLSEDNYQSLVHLSNRIKREAGCQCAFFLFGQPELAVRRNALRDAGQQEIIERFMVRDFEFHGVRTEADMQGVLAEYDRTMWPEDTDWSVPRFFFQDAVDAGRGFADFGNDLYQEFTSVITKAKAGGITTGRINIPMVYVTRVIETLCKKHGYGASDRRRWPTLADLKSAVTDCGYAYALALGKGRAVEKDAETQRKSNSRG